MKWAAIALLSLTVSVPTVANEKIVPTTEADFGRLLLGCWGDDRHADFVDGTEASEEMSLCFNEGGQLLTAYASSDAKGFVDVKGDGRYELREQRLYLSRSHGREAWLWSAAELNCSTTMQPDDFVEFTDCRDEHNGPVTGALWFGRLVEQ